MFFELWNRAEAAVRRRRLDREIDAEMRFHLAMQIEANIRSGMSADEARRVALIAFGGTDQTAEACRQTRATWLDSILRDVGYALRRFRRQPGLAAAIVLTIGMAVGLTTSVYSIATGVLLRPLPFDAPDRLVQVWKTDPDWPRMSVSVPEYLEWSRDCRSFEVLAAARPPVPFRLMKAGGAELAEGLMVSPNLFRLLGVRPFLGRPFLDREDQQGSNQVVILDEGFWRRSFGADPNIIGRRVRLVCSLRSGPTRPALPRNSVRGTTQESGATETAVAARAT